MYLYIKIRIIFILYNIMQGYNKSKNMLYGTLLSI